ncbi:HTH domain-containing protein [Luteococcus peritonei]|uniref:HTH domain-containing protein n=1 Tax=Luteococcus peritonei TaxID=88874 RepID=A0ABW4RUH5_9ACTN
MSRSPRRRPTRGARQQQRATTRQLARQQDVLRVLLQQRGKPLAVDVLAKRVGVSERTVERDLERIRSARLPLRGRGGSGGGVWLDVTRARSSLSLSDEQVMALLLVIDEIDADLPETLGQVRDLLRSQLADPRLF